MGFDVSAIDRHRAAKMAGGCQRIEHGLPDPEVRSAIEAIVDRRARTVFARSVPPAAARLKDMKNAAYDPAVVDTPGSRLILWQYRLDQRPGGGSPERIARHYPRSRRFSEQRKSNR